MYPSIQVGFVYDDGGRSQYFKGTTGDCVVRAFAILLQQDYKQTYNELKQVIGSTPRNGVPRKHIRKYAESKGLKRHSFNGRRPLLDDFHLQHGNCIVSTAKHLFAIVDGNVHDLYDCRFADEYVEGQPTGGYKVRSVMTGWTR